MSSRKGRATSSARSRPTARFATCPTPRSSSWSRSTPGDWFNAKQVEDAVDRRQRGRRQPRLCLRRHQPGLRPRCRKAADERHLQGRRRRRASMSSGSTSPATPPPATRSSAANSGSTRATRSTRSSSSAARTASRASAFSRKSSRSSRPKARRPTASSSASTSRKSRPASCQLSGGYSSLERFVVQLAVSQNNFMGKGQQLDASVNYSRYSKSVQLGFIEPYFLDKQILLGGADLPARLQQLQFRRQRAQHDLLAGQHRRRLAHRLPAHRISGASAAATVWSSDKITLDKSTFYTDPDGPAAAAVRSAQGRPLSVRRNRQRG